MPTASLSKLVVAAAGVQTNCVSPVAEISKSTSDAALDSITEPVAQTIMVPAASKVRVLTPDQLCPLLEHKQQLLLA